MEIDISKTKGSVKEYFIEEGTKMVSPETKVLPIPFKIYIGERRIGWFEGNAFLVRPDVLMTAGHCLVKSKSNYFDLVYIRDPHLVEIVLKLNGNAQTIHVKDNFFRKGILSTDFGFIKLPESFPANLVFELDNDRFLGTNPCTAIGYFPKGQQLRQVELSAERRSPSSHFVYSDTPLPPGFSGSPLVYNIRGKTKVVGVYVGADQNRSKFIPINREVLRFLDKV